MPNYRERVQGSTGIFFPMDRGGNEECSIWKSRKSSSLKLDAIYARLCVPPPVCASRSV